MSPQEPNNAKQAPKSWQEARQTLDSWNAGARALALTQAALDLGILDAARSPRTVEDLTAATGIERSRMADLCRALEAHEIVVRSGDFYELAPPFALLLSPEAFQPLEAALAGDKVILQLLAGAANGVGNYSSLSREDRLNVARSVTVDPMTIEITGVAAASFRATRPEMHALFEKGARHLELGSGVAGLIRTLLQIYPALRAVGVELDPDLVDYARKRAVEQGVAERVEWRVADAATITDEDAFDSVFWSQGFFPETSRAAVLRAAMRALRPGGYLMAPLGPVLPVPSDALHTPEGKWFAAGRVIYSGWGIPERDAVGLQAELEEAGFSFVRLYCFPSGAPQAVLVRRPQVAGRH